MNEQDAAPATIVKRSNQFTFEEFERLVHVAYQRGLTIRRPVGSYTEYEVRAPDTKSRHLVSMAHCDDSCTAHSTTGVCSHRALLIHRQAAWIAWVPVYQDGTPVDWPNLWRSWLLTERAQDAGELVVEVPDAKPPRRRRSKAVELLSDTLDAVEAFAGQSQDSLSTPIDNRPPTV